MHTTHSRTDEVYTGGAITISVGHVNVNVKSYEYASCVLSSSCTSPALFAAAQLGPSANRSQPSWSGTHV